MLPYLFEVGGFRVPTYGVALGLGLFVGLLYGTRQAARDGLPPDWAWDLGILAMFGAVIGGRLEYVRTHFERFVAHPEAIFALRDGGVVFYGGFVASTLAFVVYAKVRGVPALAILDMMAPSVGFGHAVGRLGCLGAGCCYGAPASGWWSLTFPEEAVAPAGVPLIPTQVHEILFNFAMGLFLVWMPRRFVGQRLAVLLVLYPIFRAVNEGFRGDEERGRVLGTAITNGQLTSVVLVFVAAAIWVYGSRHHRIVKPASP